MRVVALSVLLLPMLACSSKSTTSTWTYTVDFGSVAAAVSADTVGVEVYDGTKDDTHCDALVEARRTKVPLPKAVASIPATTVCALTNGGGRIDVPYGKYSVLVVARRQSQDWFIGCNTQYVTPDEDPGTLPIPLTNFDDTVQVAPSSCTSLAAHCGGGC
jgi:hypothetical protein